MKEGALWVDSSTLNPAVSKKRLQKEAKASVVYAF